MADNVPKLGEIITGEAHRDAVHVAVAPLIAGCPLTPGEAILLSHDQAFPTDRGHGLGIVDPFLKAEVRKGERFYCFLYPNTAIGLRHVYRHPELDADAIRRETMEALRAPAVEFIEECAKKIEMTYGQIMYAADTFTRLHLETEVDMSTSNAAMDIDWPKFWTAYEVINGVGSGPAEMDQEPFVCRC